MAVTFKDYDSAAGVTYRCITDTQADWGDVPVGTYFFDLETILPYYRDLQGYVVEVFTTGQSGNVTTFANVDKQLISGGALWNSGMTFDVSNLTYSFDGTIQTTNGPSTVTLSVGDASFDRIDAIVVNDDSPYGVVSVIEGQPATNPGTPEIPLDKLLVQLIIVATGATSIAVNQDIIYDENTEWTGSVADAGGFGTLDFASTIPIPQQGTNCLRVADNNRRRWARFTRTSPILSSDYTSISGYFYAEEYAPKRRLYIRFRSGTSYVGNGVYVTNTFASTSTPSIWQQFTVPLYLFNLPSVVDGVDVQYMGLSNALLNNWALDFVRLQGGFNPAQISSNNANIYNSNGSLTANRTVDQGSFDLLFKGDQNSKIDHIIISTLNPNNSSSSQMTIDSTNFFHNDDTRGFQGNLYLTPGNSYMSVTNSATTAAGQVSFNADGSSLSHYDGISTTREIRVDVDGVSINQQYKFPNADGLTGQVMTTDGSGQLSFSTPSDNSSFQVAILAKPSGYETDAFWFNNGIDSYLAGGGTVSLSVESMVINGSEKITSPSLVLITGATGATNSWLLSSAMYPKGYYAGNYSIIGDYDGGNGPKIPVKWLGHLDNLGSIHRVKFSGVTSLTQNSISLRDDTDFTLIIKRSAPGYVDFPSYWYKWDYSSSTKIAVHTFASAGITGPYIAWQYGVNSFIGPFYE